MIYQEEAFCFYCQKQYASPGNLRRHIARQHEGTYKYWDYVRKGELPDPVKESANART